MRCVRLPEAPQEVNPKETVSDNAQLEAAKIRAETRKELAEAKIAEVELTKVREAQNERHSQANFNRVLNFYGPVNSPNVDAAITAIEYWARRDPGQPQTISFHTPGGDIIGGLALYDTIQRHRRAGVQFTTRATGMAASMGAVLLQAGDERVMDARAKLLIHEGSSMLGGTPGEVEDQAELWKMLRGDLFDILAERSTLSRKQIEARAKRKDWWLPADEALKLGFVDRVE